MLRPSALTGQGALGLVALASLAAAPPKAPVHPPPEPGAGFSRPAPRPRPYRPPPGVEACRYRLDETTTALLDGEPHEKIVARVDYALERVAPSRLRAVVHRVRAEARLEGYEAALDSARPGDLRRIRGGADTLIAPRMVELFSLLAGPVTFVLEDGAVTRVEGSDRIRAAFVSAHPPAAREEAPYQQRVAERLSDARLARWLLPSATLRAGESTSSKAELRQEGLRATGVTKTRASSRGGRRLVEETSAFTPAGPIPGRSPLPGPARARLAGKRERSVEFDTGNPCFIQAGERWSTRMDWKIGEGPIQPLDRQRTRTWLRSSTAR